MLFAVLAMLLVFYAGAVLMSGYAWASAWRGAIGFGALRDLTGIADRAVLRRCFGPAQADGSYRTSIAHVMQHRRAPGVILSDLPVHLLFLATLAWATYDAGAPTSLAIVGAAAIHATVVAAAAVMVIVGNRQAILP